jgi:branched-chain amino acid transport system ATP-binding protein
MTNLLEVDHIEVIYDNVILGIKDINLVVKPNNIVGLLGANGAGKSTTLKAISGLIYAERGRLTRGNIRYQGSDISSLTAADIVSKGLTQVLEGRHCFGHLSVEENLQTGAFINKPTRAKINHQLEKIFTYFPRLKHLRKRQAGYISGGEQQMVAIGRALMSAPKLVLLDEPSMGLAPQIVEEIFEIIFKLKTEQQMSFLLAEQNAALTLEYADTAYLLENGETKISGDTKELTDTIDLAASYLGSDNKKELIIN